MNNILFALNTSTDEQKMTALVAQLQSLTSNSVDSSFVDNIQYDSTTKTLKMTLGEHDYMYFNISPVLYEQFMNANSKGTFLNTVIKRGLHPFVRLF